MWTAVRRADGALLVPFHVEIPGYGHADGAIAILPEDPSYSEFAVSAIDEAALRGDPEQDVLLIASWEAA